jgi:hypothetical protein
MTALRLVLAVPNTARRLGSAAAWVGLVSGAVLLVGCLGKPEIEDRWTRIDVTASSLTPYQVVPAGAVPIAMSVDVIYRSILTGFAVAELRASPTLSAAEVVLVPDGDRLRMATDIDRVLRNSVTMGRATRAVTGWDHLIQHIDFNFTGFVPTTLDSAGVPLGPPRGLFLVCYMGSGQEVRLPSGADSIVVTPFDSQTFQVLPVGMEITGP